MTIRAGTVTLLALGEAELEDESLNHYQPPELEDVPMWWQAPSEPTQVFALAAQHRHHTSRSGSSLAVMDRVCCRRYSSVRRAKYLLTYLLTYLYMAGTPAADEEVCL
mgnify:CR=1 FL=1